MLRGASARGREEERLSAARLVVDKKKIVL